MDCGAKCKCRCGIEKLWDWNKCACHMLHLPVNAVSLNCCNNWCTPSNHCTNCTAICFSRSICGMEEIQKEAARGCGRCEFRVWGWREDRMWRRCRCGADRGPLRLHAPVKTRWNSVFDCINRALQLKDAINKVLREWHGIGWSRSTVKTMKIRQMGKLAELSRKWCAQHIPILCCSLIFMCVFLLLRFVSLWCLQSLHVAGVWVYFHPWPLGMLWVIEEQDESVESNDRRVRIQQARYRKQRPYLAFGSCCMRPDQALELIESWTIIIFIHVNFVLEF